MFTLGLYLVLMCLFWGIVVVFQLQEHINKWAFQAQTQVPKRTRGSVHISRYKMNKKYLNMVKNYQNRQKPKNNQNKTFRNKP